MCEKQGFGGPKANNKVAVRWLYVAVGRPYVAVRHLTNNCAITCHHMVSVSGSNWLQLYNLNRTANSIQFCPVPVIVQLSLCALLPLLPPAARIQ